MSDTPTDTGTRLGCEHCGAEPGEDCNPVAAPHRRHAVCMPTCARVQRRTENDRKREFIAELARFLTSDQARMSIKLEMGDPAAHAWAKLRHTTPLDGYPTQAQAEEVLRKWLGVA